MKTNLLLLLLTASLAACTGGGGGGGESGGSDKAKPKEKLESVNLEAQSIYSNDGAVEINIPHGDKIQLVEVFDDPFCQNKVMDIQGAALEEAIQLSLPSDIERSISYYAILSLKNGLTVECKEIFTYTFDATAPADLVSLPAEVLALDGSRTASGVNVQGTASDLKTDQDVATVLFYSDALKTELIGSMSLEDYEKGGSFNPPASYENTTFDMYIAVADKAGNESDVFGTPVSVTHDSLPPVVPTLDGATTALNNTYSNSQTNYSLDFDVDDSDTESVEIFVNGVLVETVNPVPVGGNILTSVDVDENASNVVTIVTIDDLGNRDETTTLAITHDNIAPNSPTVTIPALGSVATPSVVVASDESAGVVRLYSDVGCSTEVVLDDNNLSGGALSTLVGAGASLAGDTTHTFYAQMTDLSMNVGTCDLAGSYVFDATPPVLTVTYDKNGGDINASVSDFGLIASGDCEDGTDVQMTVNSNTTTVACSGGVFAMTEVDLSVLPDGDYTIDFSHYDLAGNESTYSSSFRKDLIAPSAPVFDTATENKITSALVKDMCSSNSCMTVSNAALDSDIDNVEVYSDAGLTSLITTLSSSDIQTSGDILLTANSSNTIYLVSVDLVGNKSLTRTITITHDNVPPATPTLGASSSSLDSQTTSQFENVFDAVCDGTTTHYRLYNSSMTEVETLTSADYAAQGSHFDIIATADSVNNFYATCLDAAQNESPSVNLSFTHNAVVPTIDDSTSVTASVGTYKITGVNTIVVNPGESGTINLAIATSALGFDINQHDITIPSVNISNCVGESDVNPSTLGCDYDYSGVSAPFSESIIYNATDEWGVQSADKTISIELNEGPQL